MNKNILKNNFVNNNIIMLKDNLNNNIIDNIKDLYTKSLHEKQSFLCKISKDIYCLSIYDSELEKIKIKKISDKMQYNTIPSIENNETFLKITFASFKIGRAHV